MKVENLDRASAFVTIVGAFVVLVFFTNVAVYGGQFLWSVQPIHFIVLLLLAMVPASVLSGGLRINLFAPLALWCFGYFALCCISYALVAPGPTEPLKNRSLAMVFMLATFVLFSHSAAVTRAIRWSLVPCVLFGTVMNAYHLANPLSLIPADSEFLIFGRAAGLYINPNQAAAALLLGLILTIDLIRPALRPIYLAIISFGVLLTLSRAGIVAIALVTLTFLYSRQITWAQAFKIGVVSGVAIWVLMRYFEVVSGDVNIDLGVLLDRVDWFSSLGQRADFSQGERAQLAEMGLNLFAENPYLGAGLGSTELWNARTSTHNWYLMAMVDFGILGILIFPLLVAACVGGIRGVFERNNLPFVVFMLWWGMFSHNIVGEYFFMIGMSLAAAMSSEGFLSRRRVAVEQPGRRDMRVVPVSSPK